jgi:hypothetical protein
MAKEKKIQGEPGEEMTLEEAQAYRASLAPSPAEQPMTIEEKREEFRKYWALNKAKFGQVKEIEPIIWTHLKAVQMDHPSQFEQGLKHFGLEKVN